MLSLFRKKLPHCDTLFKSYLSPWYPGNDRPTITRPDMYGISGYKGEPLDMEAIQYLTEEGQASAKEYIAKMHDAALEDHEFLRAGNPTDLDFLEAFDKHYDSKLVAALIKESDPKDFGNRYLVTVCELGVFLGQLFCKTGKYDWLYSFPYFHSIVVEKETGWGITVFDWAVKKFSGYGINDGLVPKFKAALGEGVIEGKEIVYKR